MDLDHDWEALTWEQMGELAKLAAELDDAEWDQPSLCDGWRVRDVYGHMCVGHTYPMVKIVGPLVASGFNVDKGSAKISVTYATAHEPAELASTIDGIARDHTRKGFAKLIPFSDAFVDHVIHELDIRVPLDKQRDLPAERMAAALDAMLLAQGGGTKPKKRMEGLRFVATDVVWSTGSGPEVAGTGEALLMAIAGRSATLSQLSGEGADTLRARVAG